MRISYHKSERRSGPVVLPLSKSIGARAQILAYIYGGAVMTAALPDCDDSYELSAALNMLRDNDSVYGRYDLGTGGTSLRFFLALAASLEGFKGEIDCSEALRRRPIAPLVDALRDAGADIEYMEEEGRPPFRVEGRRLRGTDMVPGASMSSQYVSALMMASLLWEKRYEPQVMDISVSTPYIRMTQEVMRQFAQLDAEAEKTGSPEIYDIEADWSAASYFYELALADPGRKITLRGLLPEGESLQGDSACARIYGRLGVSTIYGEDGTATIEGDPEAPGHTEIYKEDMRGVPDLVPSLVVGLCMAGIRYELRGVGHLRHKESDRLDALRREMAKAGYVLQVGEDLIAWHGERKESGRGARRSGKVVFDSHGDHRTAMALSVMAVAESNVEIRGEECVEKSFPSYFEELSKVGFEIGDDSAEDCRQRLF